MQYLWNEMKEWSLSYELWVTFVLNFQRQETEAGSKEKQADTEWGKDKDEEELQQWEKIWECCEGELQYQVLTMLHKLESPGPGEYRQKDPNLIRRFSTPRSPTLLSSLNPCNPEGISQLEGESKS